MDNENTKVIGIFDELKEANNGIELSSEMKDRFIKQIDTPQNEEGYYLDAFDTPISFNGIRQLKKAYTKMEFNPHQIKEIQACYSDYYYFRRNYCKILTKTGIDRPEPRDYQKRAEEALLTGEDLILFFPRQCVSADTIIKVNNKDITIEEYFHLNKNYINQIKVDGEKYIESYRTNNDEIYSVLNTSIEIVHKTIEYEKIILKFNDGSTLSCSEYHILIDTEYNEIHAKDSLNRTFIGKNGDIIVTSIEYTNIKESMYDLSLNGSNELFYTNNVLSHNSGKTVTIATYLLWKALTDSNINIGITANVVSLAREVLDKIKKIFIELPIWLQPGLMSWNKSYIEFDNGNKILTAASNSNAFRGYSLKIMYCDEAAFIRNSDFEEYMDSVMPAMAAIQDSQAIFSSTANGLNFFYHMVEGARKGKNGYTLVEASWLEVPRWHKDGRQMTPEEFKQQQIEKNGELHFQQNFGNSFLGSSSTLISTTALKAIKYKEDDEVIFNSIFNGLRIFEEPEPGHYYILTADPKQEGQDSIGIHVIDVTKLPFKQVATANLDESFVVIPNRIFDLGTYYNNAYIIQENNTEATLINLLVDQLEYPGDVFIERNSNGKFKRNLKGIRTTVRTKKLMLSLLKKFIEEDMLIINDKITLDEMYNFIEKKNGSFSAEDGYKDDLVMSLSLLFAPFLDVKNWENFKGFSEILAKKKEEREQEELETMEFLSLGSGPNDLEDNNYEGFTRDLWDDDISLRLSR